MAGDWMKIELELPDKPEVHYIAGVCKLDPDAVVGKLVRVWQWFNKHTLNGNAHGVTFALVDRIAGVTGFGEAMQFAGWLDQQDMVLVMPKFDRHTSESAKKRALTAERQSRHRNAKVTLSALPREEKSKPPISPKVDSVAFARFWETWPSSDRKVGKAKCAEKWHKSGLDGLADQIIAHVAAMKGSDQWNRGYEPSPLTYLNQRRWEDGNTQAEKRDWI